MFCFPRILMFPETDIEILGTQNKFFRRESLSAYCSKTGTMSTIFTIPAKCAYEFSCFYFD